VDYPQPLHLRIVFTIFCSSMSTNFSN